MVYTNMFSIKENIIYNGNNYFMGGDVGDTLRSISFFNMDINIFYFMSDNPFLRQVH